MRQETANSRRSFSPRGGSPCAITSVVAAREARCVRAAVACKEAMNSARRALHLHSPRCPPKRPWRLLLARGERAAASQ